MTSTFNEEALLILVLEIGVVIIFSLIAAKVLGKRGIPQVLGLIFAGIALQFLTFYTSFPTPPTPEIHYIVTTGALGYIGYGIGAHLDLRRLLNESWGITFNLNRRSDWKFSYCVYYCNISFSKSYHRVIGWIYCNGNSSSFYS